MKLNPERFIVAYSWFEEHRTMDILKGSGFDMHALIKEKENKILYLEKKYPFLKDIKKILFSKRSLKLNKWNL